MHASEQLVSTSAAQGSQFDCAKRPLDLQRPHAQFIPQLVILSLTSACALLLATSVPVGVLFSVTSSTISPTFPSSDMATRDVFSAIRLGRAGFVATRKRPQIKIEMPNTKSALE